MSHDPTIRLREGIARLQEACEQTRQEVVFYCGAGVSADTVPLAEEICRDLIRRGEGTPALRPRPRQDEAYTACLTEAYPDEGERGEYLESLASQGIGEGVFLLARLLIGRRPGRILLTGNFDGAVGPAIRHFGEEAEIQEGAGLSGEAFADPDRIHVWEIQGAGRSHTLEGLESGYPVDPGAGPEDGRDLEPRIARLLEDRIPVVTGFSGRENNPFMRALHRTLRERGQSMPVFWFLHRKEERYALPDWLTGHPAVSFIAAEMPEKTALFSFRTGELDRALPVSLGDVLGWERPGTLPATAVFRALIGAYGIPVPDLVEQPDVYLTSKQDRLLTAYRGRDEELLRTRREDFSVAHPPAHELDAVLSRARRCDFTGALGTLVSLAGEGLEPPAALRYAQAALFVCGQLCLVPDPSDPGEAARRGSMETVLEYTAGLAKSLGGPEAERVQLESRWLLGTLAAGRGDTGAAAAHFSEVREMVLPEEGLPGDLAERWDRMRVLSALWAPEEPSSRRGKTPAGEKPGQKELAVAAAFRHAGKQEYDKALLALGDSGENGEFAAGFLKVLCRYSLGQFEGLDSIIDRLVRESGEREPWSLPAAVLLFLQAAMASETEDAYPIKAWNRVIHRLEGAFHADLRRIRAWALFHKAAELRAQGSFAESIKTYNQIGEDYGRDSEPAQGQIRARAALEKARVKVELRWTAEARRDLEDFVEEQGGDPSPEARALLIQGRLALARLYRDEGETGPAEEAFAGIPGDFDPEESPEIRAGLAEAHYEAAALAAGRREYKECLERLVRLTGEFREYQNPEVIRILADAYLLGARIYSENRYYQECAGFSREGIGRLEPEIGTQVRARLGELYLLEVESLEECGEPGTAVERAGRYLDLTEKDHRTELREARSRVLIRRARLLQKTGDPERALADCDAYVTLYGDSDRPEIRRDLLGVFRLRGQIQRQLGQSLHALQSLDRVIRLAEDSGDPGTYGLLAEASLEKAAIHLEQEQYLQQRDVLDRMVRFLGAQEAEGLLFYRMRALYARAKCFLQEKKKGDALEDLRQVRTLASDGPDALQQGVLARAVRLELMILSRDRTWPQVRSVSESVVDRLRPGAQENDTEYRRDCLSILNYRQNALIALADHPAVLENSRRIVEAYGEEPALEYRKNVAQACLDRVEAAYEMRDQALLEAEHTGLQERIGSQTDVFLREILARSLEKLGDIRAETGDPQGALRAFGEMAGVFGEVRGDLPDRYRSRARHKLGRTYSGIGNHKQALHIYEEVVSSYGQSQDPGVRLSAHRSALDLCGILVEQRKGFRGRRGVRRALREYDRLLAAETLDDGELVLLQAKAWAGKGRLLAMDDQREAAARVFGEMMDRYQDTEDPRIRTLWESVREEKDGLALASG